MSATAPHKPGKMIKVETVDLATRNIVLPSDRVGMVIAQPHFSLSATEPYRCTAQSKPKQLKALTDTLAVAQAAGHRATKTHFTVFPEYSVPGLEGISLIEGTLASAEWPVGTIVIGGTDGLLKNEITTLIGNPRTYFDATNNDLTNLGDHEWINCGITWVKGQDGAVERWLQPKLHPAKDELDTAYQSMFRGHSIYVFKGLLANNAPFRFATLVCFDWIATVETKKSFKWILEDVHQQAGTNQLPLSWLFVIQRNPRPSHDTFLREVETFYDQNQSPNALRNNACIVFANNAGIPKPGRSGSFGGCSLVFSDQTRFIPGDCVPTFSNGGSRYRDGSAVLNPYKDVFFRERGACIHSFAQINPGSLNAGAAGRLLAVEYAEVYPLSEDADPRAPGTGVPACIKWLNDELDDLQGLNIRYPAYPLAAPIGAIHQSTVAALRMVEAKSVAHGVTLATQGSQAKNADQWDRIEKDAVEHLVDTLNIVSLGATPPSLGADPAHAVVALGGQPIDLLAIRGSTHEECIKHSQTFLPLPRRKSLLVSRDVDNNAWSQRFGSFLETPAQLTQEQKFTDPSSGLLHLGYRRLLDIFQASATVNDLQGAINAELA